MNSNKYKDIYYIDSGVEELKYSDFKINKKKIILKKKNNNLNGLVIVYAPWCKHCKEIVDTWSELAIENMYRFYIASINSEDLKNKNDHITSKLKVIEYPTLFSIKKSGLLTKYVGSISRDDIQYHISINSL